MRHHSMLVVALLLLLASSTSFVFPAFAEEEQVKETATVTVVIAETDTTETAVTVPQIQLPETEEIIEAPKSPYIGTIWALLPPVIAIVLALLTKEVYSSLFIGIIAGALLATDYGFNGSMSAVLKSGFISAISDQAGISLFLVILGIIVSLINKTGATASFGRWAEKKIRTQKGASFATFFLGIMIFIDDYFNCLTVGSVMLPVTDAKKISRAKLAYLIDATAAPICMIAPISSWAAAVCSFSKDTGVNGYDLFIKAIPFNLYSLLTIAFILTIIFLQIDYGPMRIHERNAKEKGDLFTNGSEVDNGVRMLPNAKGKFIDMVIPVLALIFFSVYALLLIGGYPDCSLQEAFGNTDATVGLPWGGLLTLLVSIIYLVSRRVIKPDEAMKSIPEGCSAMVPAIIILTMATSLKNMTGLLEAKEFIAEVTSGQASAMKNFMPAGFFLIACGLAFATGTSWGTFGILIPIVTRIYQTPGDPFLYIGMSACLAGAVCGDHCSPISDTTIMSSAGARCPHINHVSTQLPYALTVAFFSFIGYVITGFTQNWFVVFPATLFIMVFFLVAMKHKQERKCCNCSCGDK